MVYLDRPDPAGYFIFPDLSVRHEGRYRLGFSLYEELKDLKDDDSANGAGRAASPEDSCVTHGLEVKSEPFHVFSAKKFPGLTESTSLSRIVADQGCRVRIRRDVRMRRRDTKAGGKEWDDYESDTARARARMSATPDPSSAYPTLPTPHGYVDANGRARSGSNASHHSLAQPLSRRTSLQELNPGYSQTFGSGPHTPQNGYVQSSPYGPSPSQHYQQPPFMQQPTMQPPPPQYPPQQAYHAPPPLSAPSPSQPSYYGYAPAPSSLAQPQHAPPASYEHAGRLSGDFSAHVLVDHRHYPAQYTAPPPPPQHYPVHAPTQAAYQPPPQQSNYPIHAPTPAAYQPPHQQPHYPAQHSHQSSYSSQDSFANRAPPPQPVQPPVRSAGAHTPLSFPSYNPGSALPLPQVTTDVWPRKLEPPPAQGLPSDAYAATTASASTAADTRKRHHGSVFHESEQYGPLRQGARPSEGHTGGGGGGAGGYPGGETMEAGEELDGGGGGETFVAWRALRYRRAGGVTVHRELPPHSDD
ncbi:velum formation- protein [Teratosphaeriaceae sp. CCFEE 6253]|nr:velum formation- protein [Teratosphaeriaceae sp. CCFEE 6253]